jgi:TRAP-type C4-dicarboxylate transport system substrate-binding protein
MKYICKYSYLVFAFVVMVLSLSHVAFAQEVTLRLHQFLPAQSVIPKNAIAPWAKRIEEESNGAIKIELYPSMQLGGSPPQLFDQAKDGVADIIWTVLGYTPGRFPKSEVFETPFMITNAKDSSMAFQAYVEQYAMDEFDDVKLIAVHTHGPGVFHSKKPITKLEDLKGMKIRGGSRVINNMLKSLGAEPIGMPVPSIPEALSRGVIDGATIPWEVSVALKTSELVKNHTGFSGDHGLYSQTFALVMNKKSYENLSPELQAIIDANSGIVVAAKFGAEMDAADIVGRQFAADLGNEIIILDAIETQRWKEAAQGTVDEWIKDTPNGQMLYDGARELVEKYSSESTY